MQDIELDLLLQFDYQRDRKRRNSQYNLWVSESNMAAEKHLQ